VDDELIQAPDPRVDNLPASERHNGNSEDNGPFIKVIIEITKMRIISLLFIVGVLGTGKERRKEK
jgi:hypothetical protein